MATVKETEIKKPLIQIDDEIREMTDEEYADFIEQQKTNVPIVIGE